MKLSLVVLSPGKMEGKSIPITTGQFLIGRDPDCHLRPTSALISKRHCALLIKGNDVFVRDFESTNGTTINDQPVRGERALHHGDRLKIGPLEFRTVIEVSPPVSQPTPVPAATARAEPSPDEAAAAVLLSVQDDTAPPLGSLDVDSDGVPTGSTVMDVVMPQATDTSPKEEGKGGAGRAKAAKVAEGNTSSAAKSILEKYMRRPRR